MIKIKVQEFAFIKNRDAIHKEISNLLIDRQNITKQDQAVQPVQQTNNLEQIKELKEMLDSGIISQEEFDAKKKQLLGL